MSQHSQLIDKARAIGASVQDVNHLLKQNASILTHKGISDLIIEGVPTSWINVRSQFYCDNKQLTKQAYEILQIPHPKSITFQQVDDDSPLADFLQYGQKYVCKPLDGTNGIGVVLGIEKLEEVISYYVQHKQLSETFLLEEQIEGQDLRIHVLGGKIVAACIREPAFVVGNGHDSLEVLIENRRAVIQQQNPLNFLHIDEATESLLQEQKITLTSIPPSGQKIQLKYVSNMAQGGIATDVTDEIHPIYYDWVQSLVAYLRTDYFGLDIITSNHQLNPKNHAWVLEINARADWLHHTFSERRTHDIGGMILTELFGN